MAEPLCSGQERNLGKAKLSNGVRLVCTYGIQKIIFLLFHCSFLTTAVSYMFLCVFFVFAETLQRTEPDGHGV